MKLAWVGSNGEVDDIDLWGSFAKSLDVGSPTSTKKNKTYSNEEAYNFEQHVGYTFDEDLAVSAHGLAPLNLSASPPPPSGYPSGCPTPSAGYLSGCW